jgi:hypothetical protein
MSLRILRWPRLYCGIVARLRKTRTLRLRTSTTAWLKIGQRRLRVFE